MPAKSEKQQRFAAMSKTKEGRAKLKKSGKEPMPKKAASHYAKKSK